MYRKYRQTPQRELHETLKELNKSVAKQMRCAELEHLGRLTDRIKNNPKEVWKYVKSKQAVKETIPDVIDDLNFSADLKGKAERFNFYFQSVFTQSVCLPSGPQLVRKNSEMIEICFTERGVLALLQKIKVNAAPGPDAIPNYVLKNCAASLVPFLVLLFEKSMALGCLPDDWKSANVAPIFKAGDKTRTKNYRPISLTCVICKLMEHIIYTNLISHLQDNNFFCTTQHGFRKGLSCDTQLIEFSHDIAASIDNGCQVDCVFLDFQKAFDSVSHNLLLLKLSALNIPPSLLKWLEAYLVGRKQRVVLEGVNSSEVDVLSGVPQGSVLGPLLFLIFINDITQQVSSRMRMYADDCCIYRDVTSAQDSAQLQSDLNAVLSWCTTWNMTLNFSKCNTVRFTNKKNILNTNYFLGDNRLEVVSKYKYLGVFFTSNLSWNDHIEYVGAKASRVLNFLKRNFKQAPPKLKETLYLSNVRSILEYGCVAWDPDTKICTNALERVQKRAARFVSGNYDFTNRSSCIRKHLGWPLLQDRRKFLRLNLFHNIYIGSTGLNKDVYIKDPTYVSSRLDHSRKVREYRCRINTYKNSFFPKTTHEWNNLPEYIVSTPPPSFQNALSQFLLK